MDVDVDSIIVTLPRAFATVVGIELMKRPRPTLRVLLRETGSTTDIWLAPYMRLAGVCLSLFRRLSIFNGGPRKGCNRDNYLIDVVVVCS